jgi:hypothetical protein
MQLSLSHNPTILSSTFPKPLRAIVEITDGKLLITPISDTDIDELDTLRFVAQLLDDSEKKERQPAANRGAQERRTCQCHRKRFQRLRQIEQAAPKGATNTVHKHRKGKR